MREECERIVFIPRVTAQQNTQKQKIRCVNNKIYTGIYVSLRRHLYNLIYKLYVLLNSIEIDIKKVYSSRSSPIIHYTFSPYLYYIINTTAANTSRGISFLFFKFSAIKKLLLLLIYVNNTAQKKIYLLFYTSIICFFLTVFFFF